MAPNRDHIKIDNNIGGVGADILVDQEQKHDESECEATIGNGHAASLTREKDICKEGHNLLEVVTDSDPQDVKI